MSVDDAKTQSSASKSEVALVSIYLSAALESIVAALKAIKAGSEISDSDIKAVEEAAARMEKHFDILTGWTSDK